MAQADEAATLQLRDEQARLLRSVLEKHQGREVKSMGDGFLVEFDSALRAVQCAIEIQTLLEQRNARRELRPIELRIGIHLGDVEQRDADILGDAVNIASRIEPLASPRGICVSGEVYRQVRNKLTNTFEQLPPTPLKGIRDPVDVYRVLLNRKRSGPPSGATERTGLAVLPFANISPDPNDEYFADGLTEELISVLSQLKGLRVIARTSVAPYKATPKGVAQIGAELRVASVLEGSVRKAGNRLRVTAQLIDVSSEGHIWAHTYDRSLDDIFAVQAELAGQVADALKLELQPSETVRLEERPVIASESYLAYLRGRAQMRSTLSSTPESISAAMEQFELAIGLDERNAAAYSGLADAHRFVVYSSGAERRSKADLEGRRLVKRALELDPNLAEAHASLALIIWDDYEYVAAEREYQIALSLNPSYAFAHCFYGVLLEDEGRVEEALNQLLLAEESDPLGQEILLHLIRLLSWSGRFEEARSKLERLETLAADSASLRISQLWYYRARGDVELFSKVARRWAEDQANETAKKVVLALECTVAGRLEVARELLESVRGSSPSAEDESNWAMVFAEAGDLEGCFRLMNLAFEHHSLGFQPFRLDPRLENVRRDPRFRDLQRRMNLA